MTGCPDLKPFFKHYRWAAMPHSFGVPIGCDWSDKSRDDPVFGLHTQVGSWTPGEVGILFNVARQIGGYWLDIGGNTGWTAAHLAKAGCEVDSIDPMYSVAEFEDRTSENLLACNVFADVTLWPTTSADFFGHGVTDGLYDGVVIDGCHDAPIPLQDAQGALVRLKERGAILFHDCRGAPVQEGAQYLVDAGLEGAAYPTVHGVSLCWRGELTVPPHPSWEL